MSESLLIFFAAGIACELVAINRNSRRNIRQHEEVIQLLKEVLNRDTR